MKKLILVFILFVFACKQKPRPLLDEFVLQARASNKIVFWFNGRYPNETPFTKVIYKPIHVNELANFMEQSAVADSACRFYEGTITLYSKLKKVGFVEFSNNPACPAFFFYKGDTVVQYHMSPYCAMYLESVRDGYK